MTFAYKTPNGIGIHRVELNGTLPDQAKSPEYYDLWPVDCTIPDGFRQDFTAGTPPGWRLESGTVKPHLVAAELPRLIAPRSVTRRQLFLVLLAVRGITRDMIKSRLAGNEAALIELEEASDFRRDHPLVFSLATALGLNPAQVDALFVEASKL